MRWPYAVVHNNRCWLDDNQNVKFMWTMCMNWACLILTRSTDNPHVSASQLNIWLPSYWLFSSSNFGISYILAGWYWPLHVNKISLLFFCFFFLFSFDFALSTHQQTNKQKLIQSFLTLLDFFFSRHKRILFAFNLSLKIFSFFFFFLFQCVFLVCVLSHSMRLHEEKVCNQINWTGVKVEFEALELISNSPCE